MPALLIRHQVDDFDTWKKVFFDEVGTRRAHGSQAELVFRSSTDPKEVWVLLHWDDMFRAQLFVRSDDLLEALARAGVVDQPDYWYLEDDG